MESMPRITLQRTADSMCPDVLRDRSQEDSMIRGKNGFETAGIGGVAFFLGSVFVAYHLVDDTRNRPRRRAINFNETDGNGVRDLRMILDRRNAIL